MEATVRIAYTGGPSEPVIKIIAPKHLGEDADPKDELVRDFLSTASVVDKNQLFHLISSFPLENEFNLSIIAPIRYHDMPEKLRGHIERRVMKFDDICECREYETRIIPEEAKSVCKAPADYARYLEIKHFFDWVSEQPYVEKPR
jgi:hypothetical protein